MRSRTLIIATISLVSAVAALSCRPKPVVKEHAAGAVFEVSDSLITVGRADTLHLGRIRDGEIVVKEFALKNTGERPFVITGITTTCSCMTFGYNREPVASGNEKTVEVRFDSAGYLGEQLKKATIRTSLSEIPYTIIVDATVE